MMPTEVLDALQEHFDEIWPLLDEPERDRLRTLLTTRSDDPERTARKIVRLVLAALPDDHPVREVFEDSVRFTGGDSGPDSDAWHATVVNAMDNLRRWTGQRAAPAAEPPPPPEHPGPEHPAPEGSTPPEGADDWLLAADSRTAAECAADGNDPLGPDLIRLTGRDGTVRLPSFQFDTASGRPLPTVVAVNRLLDASDDPRGVADWWLGANAWLDAVPARLLGTPDEHSLLPAARAEIAQW